MLGARAAYTVSFSERHGAGKPGFWRHRALANQEQQYHLQTACLHLPQIHTLLTKMLAYAAKAVLGEKRFEASEAAVEWTGARDASGRAFWFNGVTHEATLEDPSKDGSYAASSSLSLPSQLQQRQSASPVAVTPFRSGCRTPGDGCVTPAECGRVTPPFYGCTAPPADDHSISGYASPPYNGYVSPPVMTPPHVRGYFSPGTGGVSPPYGYRCNQQLPLPPPPPPHQHAYPVENQSPCFAAGQAWKALPRQPRRARRQRRSDASVPPSAATAGGGGSGGGGYRWDECYKETDGKKFWRHKETGVIITEDPYH